jgi:hypothetical protein
MKQKSKPHSIEDWEDFEEFDNAEVDESKCQS